MKPAKRTEKLTPFYVMDLPEKARIMEAAGEDIAHMEIGEPDFPTPAPVREAALRAIEADHTFATGVERLKLGCERLEEWLKMVKR